MLLEGHSCDHCGCGLEHGCVCGWCDMTAKDWAEYDAAMKGNSDNA